MHRFRGRENKRVSSTMMYTYLILHLFTLLFPVSYSFESKVSFYKKWLPLFISIFSVAAFFITWDFIFTSKGIWSFNREYLIGRFLLNMPIEEWLFFITVPYSCVFIYEALNYYIKKDYLKKYSLTITGTLVLILVTVALFNFDKLYTSVTLLLTSTFLIVHWFIFKDKHMGRFYMAYLVHLIPFFIVNGVLTWLPVVLYNDNENLGIRLFTIPIEDSMYSLLLLLMNITLYEWLKEKLLKQSHA